MMLRNAKIMFDKSLHFSIRFKYHVKHKKDQDHTIACVRKRPKLKAYQNSSLFMSCHTCRKEDILNNVILCSCNGGLWDSMLFG